jgi:hypothetical protein
VKKRIADKLRKAPAPPARRKRTVKQWVADWVRKRAGDRPDRGTT